MMNNVSGILFIDTQTCVVIFISCRVTRLLNRHPIKPIVCLCPHLPKAIVAATRLLCKATFNIGFFRQS